MTSKADVLLVTVTKVESRAVMKAFEQATDCKATPQSIDNRVYFNLGTVNGARVFMTQSEMGSGGLGSALVTVSKGIDALSPVAVIMVGIAFGINEEKQAIGDILVTEQLRLYDLQRVGIQNGQLQIILRGDKPHASPWLINLFKSTVLLREEEPKVRFGVVLTGDKLVDNVDFRDQLHCFEPEAIGGEMEGAGLYVACQENRVDWILVKAICDWADGNKAQDKDARQQTAAQNAAKFVLEALQFVRIDWQQKRGGVTQIDRSREVITEPEKQKTPSLSNKNYPNRINSPESVNDQPDITTKSQASGTDYTELRDLLRDKKWREADEKTAELMLEVSKRKKEGWLDVEAIKNFPIEDLQIIDRLWVTYSKNLYGFSVQKQIWNERKDNKDWKIFGYYVGWYKNDRWLDYSDIISQLDKSPLGVLPRGGGVARQGRWLGGVSWECAELFFSHIPSLDRRGDSVIPSSADANAASDRINSPVPVNSQSEFATRSQTSGIDYKELSDLLRDKQWREADQKTAELMLKVAKRENEGWLDAEAIKKFPLEDLLIVDRLWVEYSDGKYGFSVQKKVWEECGSPKDYGREWKEFGDRVGWRRENQWLSYNSLVFHPETNPMTLPARCSGRVICAEGGWFVCVGGSGFCWSLLFSRITP
ncbi:GUN4 domain-containing protein [Pseudanabaena sp. PCC 6802]|uniref:GUN4 domain-containing protein n=1 Tax=Pseudanabaena sp. PCC 6802 TaxID=118173 RepID=UPI000349E117|nr:GUN4 domain-containing protein [Pseudanabaena sp. PCC 6802]